MNNSNTILRPWFKRFAFLLLIIELINVIISGHISFVRIRKDLPNARSADLVDGRILVDGGRFELKINMLNYIPDNIVMRSALKKGIEINSRGSIIGVLPIECPGIFNPVAKKEMYVNIIALAIVTDPCCLNRGVITDDKVLRPLLEEMPPANLRCSMKPSGWRIGNTAWLKAVTKSLSEMAVSNEVALIIRDNL